MTYAVIDTNVLVSAFISKSPTSPTKRVVELIIEGKVTPLYDKDILAEYAEVLARKKFKLDPNEVGIMLDFIRECGIDTVRKPFSEEMPDDDDRVFYEITLSMDGSFLVTGNLKHYPQSPRVISPTDFVALFD